LTLPAAGPASPRLSLATLEQADPRLIRPAYDPRATTIGTVHFGPGAFHRAHQAWYLDRLLAHDPSLAISAFSLKSPAVRDALAPQDGLYVLAELDRSSRLTAIGAIRELLVATENPAAVAARLAAPQTRLVTATVTEKGYCLDGAGDLDLAHPDIVADLARQGPPRSLIGWLVEGLRLRRAAGLAPFLTVPCDNLADNGIRLRRAVLSLAERQDPELARWIDDTARFPRTMVDSITPATDDALRARVTAETGLVDAWPVQREAFAQWVVEDLGDPATPDWARVGVTVTRDVPAFDRAKLRLLNGAHSTLAYLGLLAGFETVAEASADPRLSGFVARLMRQDILPSLRAPEGLDLDAYVQAILTRFQNPFVRHNLAQIAADGSQKLPVRILGTVQDGLEAGRTIARLAVPMAAWMRFVVQQVQRGAPLVDPQAAALTEIGRACSGDAPADVARFLALETVFPRALAAAPHWRSALEQAYGTLARDGLSALL
jgi:fructuronate reductase